MRKIISYVKGRISTTCIYVTHRYLFGDRPSDLFVFFRFFQPCDLLELSEAVNITLPERDALGMLDLVVSRNNVSTLERR